MTTVVLSLSEIKDLLFDSSLLPIIEKGFVALSSKKAVVPPVGELLFEKPVGETHIKYGYIKQEHYYVIKVASGFYENPKMGLNSSQGVILVFSQKTGELAAVLLDEGYLTDVRTAIASMITLKYLAPKKVDYIGIIGTGIQAQLQVKYLHLVSDCKRIIVWGRNKEKAEAFKEKFKDEDVAISIANSIDELTEKATVIITTTPATNPLLKAHQIKKGTHITAIGSDTSQKIELSPELIKNADVLVSDSIEQSKTRGEFFRARQKDCLNESKLIELGDLIQNPTLGRKNNQQITIADLTGVAVQDIMIANAVLTNFKKKSNEH